MVQSLSNHVPVTGSVEHLNCAKLDLTPTDTKIKILRTFSYPACHIEASYHLNNLDSFTKMRLVSSKCIVCLNAIYAYKEFVHGNCEHEIVGMVMAVIGFFLLLKISFLMIHLNLCSYCQNYIYSLNSLIAIKSITTLKLIVQFCLFQLTFSYSL